MAKYVVVAFDIDTEADAFIETMNAATITMEDNGGATVEVVGVFKKPTLFCECTNRGDKSVRGAKWGWWLHKDCGKPKRGNIHHPWNLLFPGKKLTDQLYLGIR